MPGVVNYAAYKPSANTAVSNDQIDTGIFHLVSAQTSEQVPSQDVPTLTGILRLVGLPTVVYALQYLTMEAVDSALDLEYADDDPALQLQYFGAYVDNAFYIGGSMSISPASNNRGILALRWNQNIISLSQRQAYA